jgi:hypothetical protein
LRKILEDGKISYDYGQQIMKMTILLKAIYRFHATSIRSSMTFFTGGKTILIYI